MRYLLLALLLGGCNLYDRLPRLTQLDPVQPRWRIEHVNLFDSVAARFVEDRTVIVAGTEIVWVGPSVSAPVTQATEQVLDGRGKYLLPGLIDAHVHTVGNGAPPWLQHMTDPQRNLEAFLLAGITTIADLGGMRNQVFDLRDQIRAQKIAGPHMLTAAAHFTASGGHPVALMKLFIPWPLGWLLASRFAYEVDDLGDIEDTWQDFVEHKPDLVKMTRDELPLGVPKLRPELMARLVRLGALAHLPVVAHVGTPEDAVLALASGASGLAHTPYMGTFTPRQLSKIAQTGKMVMSTAGVWQSLIELQNNTLKLSSFAKKVLDPVVLAALENRPADYELPDDFKPWMEKLQKHGNAVFTNLGMLYQNNVSIVIATDSPGVGIVAGDALHREMDMVHRRAGIPSRIVLQGATWLAARLLGIENRAGVIAADHPADLLLLDADPIQDIGNTRAVNTVWLAGQRLRSLGQGDSAL